MGISEAEFQALQQRIKDNSAIRAEVQKISYAPALDPSRGRKHKYGVAPKEERIVDGILFASKAEAQAYAKLRALQAAGQITNLERQPIFRFPMGFSYIADFRVTYAAGDIEVIDVKGVETPVFKLKAKCMAHFYPDVKLSLWKRGK